MGETQFQVGDEGVFRGRVISTKEVDLVLLESGDGRRIWLHQADLMPVPAPVTVRCDKCGVEHPLTDFPTMKARCKALGLNCSNWISLDNLVRICAIFKERGVTAEQVVEGL